MQAAKIPRFYKLCKTWQYKYEKKEILTFRIQTN